MGIRIVALLILLSLGCTQTQDSDYALNPSDQLTVTTDLANFYTAFDSIRGDANPRNHKHILETLFLAKASPGQRSMIDVRRYKDSEYLENIARYPKFYESLRPTILATDSIAAQIESKLKKLQELYPNLKPAQIFFTMGAFRSNGTTLQDRVLIGSELALVSQTTDLSEFPKDYWAREYWKSRPLDHIVKLNIHEYVHTQQKESLNTPLFVTALREGAAEFITDIVMNIPKEENHEPSIQYGIQHETEVMDAFVQDMFNTDYGYWLWSNANNPFGTRDLAYFVGYILSEKFYNSHANSVEAIASLIELNYSNPQTVQQFIDEIGYFPRPLNSYQ